LSTDAADVSGLKAFDDRRFNLFEFAAVLSGDRDGLKIALASYERLSLRSVREIPGVAPSGRAVGCQVARKNRVRAVAAVVVP